MVMAVGVTAGKAPGVDTRPGTVADLIDAEQSAGAWACGIPGLFDLPLVVAPDGGLARTDRPDTSLSAAELAGLVMRAGGDGLDVRILAPAGEQNMPTLTALADLLGCDVLVPQAGARLRYDRGGRTSDQPAGDVAALDPATGHPMDWVTIAPTGQVGSLPGWFDTTRGMVVPRTGIVALPLAGGGLMLATRRDFVRRRALAAALRPGHPELLTVGMAVRSGGFVVGDYRGQATVCDGPGLAAALSGLPLYGAELRMWLTWPEPAEERRRLAGNLTALAEVTGATVWAPAEGSRAELAEDCRDLRAVRPDGESAGWRPYGTVGSASFRSESASFRSDMDGRLVPAGGVAVTGYPGVPLVSVQPAQERAMAARYAGVPPAGDVFHADLAVLADGRLAARYADASLLAVSSGQLGQLLRNAGWQGGPLALLATVSPEQAVGAQRHATELARQLGCPVTFLDSATLDSATDRWTVRDPEQVREHEGPHDLRQGQGRPQVEAPRPARHPRPESGPGYGHDAGLGADAGLGVAGRVVPRTDEHPVPRAGHRPVPAGSVDRPGDAGLRPRRPETPDAGRAAREPGPSRAEPAGPPVPSLPRQVVIPRRSIAALAARVRVPPALPRAASSPPDAAASVLARPAAASGERAPRDVPPPDRRIGVPPGQPASDHGVGVPPEAPPGSQSDTPPGSQWDTPPCRQSDTPQGRPAASAAPPVAAEALDRHATAGGTDRVGPGTRPAPVPRPPAQPDGLPSGAGQPRDYLRAAVGRALAGLDPAEPEAAARLATLRRLIAEHTAGTALLDGEPEATQRDQLVGELDELADRIEDLAGVAGAEAVRQPNPPATSGRPGADQERAGQHSTAYGGSADRTRPGANPEPGGWNHADGSATTLLSRLIDGPRLEPAGRSAPPHGIAWLPPAPLTNSEDFDVYVECAVEPEQALAQGVPSDHLFLLGHLGRDRLATRSSAGHLLQVRVRSEGAIDVAACEAAVPRSLVETLRDNDVYLLPAAWLARCRVVAAIRVDGGTALSGQRFPEPQPLLVRCADADHGVPGLPAEVVRWPRGSLRATATRFATVPDDAPDEPGPWLRLHQQRPAPASGCRLLELRIGRGRAIDVAATAPELARLTHVRSTAAELVAAGLDVLLPAAFYPDTAVLRAFRGDGKSWQRIPVPPGTTLDSWVASSPALDVR